LENDRAGMAVRWGAVCALVERAKAVGPDRARSSSVEASVAVSDAGKAELLTEFEVMKATMESDRANMGARWASVVELLAQVEAREASRVAAVGSAEEVESSGGASVVKPAVAGESAVAVVEPPVVMLRGRQVDEVMAERLRMMSIGSSSSGEWSDMPVNVEEMEASSSSGVKSDSVAAGASAPVSESVVSDDAVASGASAGFMVTCVRTSQAEQLKKFLGRAGVRVAARYKVELALVTYTAGAMPEGFERGKDKLEVLALSGGTAMRLALSQNAYLSGHSAQQTSDLISRVLSNAALASVCQRSGLWDCAVSLAGVGPESRASTVLLQAVAGFVHMRCAAGSLEKLMVALQLL